MAKKNRAESRTERAAAALAAQRRAERKRQLWMVGGVVVVLLVIIGVGVWLQSSRDTSGSSADAPSGVTDTYGVVVGKDSAPHTVTVYEDFQCPICHDFEQATRDQLRQAVDDGKVQLDYRMVSFLDRASDNEYSSRALNAAAVVLDTSGQEVFLKFHDLLFENQPEEGTAGPDNDQLVEWAVQAGATESEVRPGIENGEFDQWVVNATDQMSKNGVNGTPTVFVDGEKVDGSTVQDSIDAALGAIGK